MQILDAVDKHLKCALSSTRRKELCGQLLTYAFRGPVSAPGLRQYVDSRGVDFDLLGFRRDLSSNGDILIFTKTFLYGHVASQTGLIPKAIPREECSVSSSESKFLLSTLKESPLLEGTLIKFARTGYKALRPHQLNRLTAEVLCTKDYESYVGKLVARKMAFLIKSFGETAHDLTTNLKLASMYSVLRTYPAYNDYTHVLRLAKSTARNVGLNIISHATTASRQRLTRDNSPLLVPLHLTEGNGGASFSDQDGALIQDSFLVVGRAGNRVSNDELDVRESLKTLLSSPKFTEKQRLFLHLMMGNYDEDFSLFLCEDNTDAVERSHERYLKDMCRYLDISMDIAQSFLRKLAVFL